MKDTEKEIENVREERSTMSEKREKERERERESVYVGLPIHLVLERLT